MPPLPSDNFSWVIPNELAAAGRPRNPRQALEFFQSEGIQVVISLTETPLLDSLIEEFGMEYHHLPVEDFGAPTDAQIDRFVEIVSRAREAGKKTVVHCFAGRGRTGTMLACYLVNMGVSAESAIEEIRALRPGSIETREQEDTVCNYERRLRQSPGG